MSISQKDSRLLFQKSGNRCAFPECNELLTMEDTTISEIAHIVAQSKDGPRGNYPLDLDKRDNYDNLILLCQKHHDLIDKNPETYPVEKLRRYKQEHEKKITLLTQQIEKSTTNIDYKIEVVYSNLLPVEMPRYLYSANTTNNNISEIKSLVESKGLYAPFILKENRLYCFNNLELLENPFRKIIDLGSVKRHHIKDFIIDENKKRWFMELLHQTLNKLTGRKDLNFDKIHKRYFFNPTEEKKEKVIEYQPLNQKKASRKVFWSPITRKTQLNKPYFFHLAVSLQFHQINSSDWVLSIRPEMHLTLDGKTPYPSEKRGSLITKKKAKKFNYDFLGDIQFWRDYLSDSKPRIIIKFSNEQFIVIHNNLMNCNINWPGMPEEHSKSFSNIINDEDLFSFVEFEMLNRYNEDEPIDEKE